MSVAHRAVRDADLALDPDAVDAAALADAYGTPLYVYDLDVVTRRVAALRAVLPARVSLAYAVKANPSLAVVAHLASLGLGADVASAAELRTALRAGIDPTRIVVTGPGKRPDEHEAAVRVGATVTVESPGELERLERISGEAGVVTRVLLRANAAEDADAEGVRIIGDAGAGKFGMDVTDLRAAARFAVGSRHLELVGLHRFGASNVIDAGRLVGGAARAIELAREVLGAVGRPVRVVDIGGGLGIPYADDAPQLDLEAFGAGLGALLASASERRDARHLELVLEPGRFIVGPAGAYVARVVDRKRTLGSEVAILDGGINHVLRPALVGRSHRVEAVARDRDSDRRFTQVTVAGPLCTGLDVLAGGVLLPELDPGDLVAVRDVGAYGFTESMPLFLSHAIPAEIVLRGGEPRLARPRTEPDEWIGRQLLPEWDSVARRGAMPPRSAAGAGTGSTEDRCRADLASGPVDPSGADEGRP